MTSASVQACLGSISAMTDAERLAILNHLLAGMAADDLLAIASSLFTSVCQYKAGTQTQFIPEDFLKCALTALVKSQHSGGSNILYLLARVLASVQEDADQLPSNSLPFAVIQLIVQSLVPTESQKFQGVSELLSSCILKSCEVVNDPQVLLDHLSAWLFPRGTQSLEIAEDEGHNQVHVLLMNTSEFIEMDTTTDSQGLYVIKMQCRKLDTSAYQISELGSYERKLKPTVKKVQDGRMQFMVKLPEESSDQKTSQDQRQFRNLVSKCKRIRPKPAVASDQIPMAIRKQEESTSSLPFLQENLLSIPSGDPGASEPMFVQIVDDGEVVYPDIDTNPNIINFTKINNQTNNHSVLKDGNDFKAYNFQSGVRRKSKKNMDIDWDKVKKKTGQGVLRLCKICKHQTPQKKVQFARQADLERHMMDAHAQQADGSYKCHLCSETSFGHKTDLELHISIHKRTCIVCQYVVPEHIQLRSHRHLHSASKKPLPCVYCSLAFATAWEHRSHVYSEHAEKLPYACELCVLRFKTRLTFDEHFEVRHQNVRRSHTCSECGAAFDFSRSLKAHVQAMHTDSSIAQSKAVKTGKSAHPSTPQHNLLLCRYCNMSFDSQEEKDQHVSDYPEHLPFPCSHCHHRFLSKQALGCHVKRHHENTAYPTTGNSLKLKSETQYVCGRCGKIEASFAAMNLHKHRVHLGNLNYGTTECEICGKTFVSKQVLKKHVACVHGQQRRECESRCQLCPRKFRRYEAFRDHMLTIHGREPAKLVCDYCKRKFRWQYTLRHHRCRGKPTHLPTSTTRNSELKEVDINTTIGNLGQNLGQNFGQNLGQNLGQNFGDDQEDAIETHTINEETVYAQDPPPPPSSSSSSVYGFNGQILVAKTTPRNVWNAILQENKSLHRIESISQSNVIEELIDDQLTFDVSEIQDDPLSFIHPDTDRNFGATESSVEAFETEHETHIPEENLMIPLPEEQDLVTNTGAVHTETTIPSKEISETSQSPPKVIIVRSNQKQVPQDMEVTGQQDMITTTEGITTETITQSDHQISHMQQPPTKNVILVQSNPMQVSQDIPSQLHKQQVSITPSEAMEQPPRNVTVVRSNQTPMQIKRPSPKHISLFSNSFPSQTNSMAVQLNSGTSQKVTKVQLAQARTSETSSESQVQYIRIGNTLLPVKELREMAHK